MPSTDKRWFAVLGTMAAYLLIIPVWIAYLLGRVKIHWSLGAQEAWRQGGVLVIANHPSLIETIVLPALFWHPAWLGDQSRIPWSLSDDKLFGNRPWIYPAFRCIAVSRNPSKLARKKNVPAIRKVFALLDKGGIMILYPEGGRTCKGESFWSDAGRRIRRFDASLIQRVAREGHLVLPVWIEHGTITETESFGRGYRKLFFGSKFRVHFGSPIQTQKSEIDEQTVALAIIRAGK